MAKMRFNRNFNISKVIRDIVNTVLALYVGGTILTTFGDVMNATTSPLYDGLSLIGWTVSASNQITDTSGSGVLAVVGILAIAKVVMNFVSFY